MTDQEWLDLCDQNYEIKAAELVADGYERYDFGNHIPTEFVKGDEALILVRQLGSAEWYTVPSPIRSSDANQSGMRTISIQAKG